MTPEQRLACLEYESPATSKRKKYKRISLLEDWKERFRNDRGFRDIANTSHDKTGKTHNDHSVKRKEHAEDEWAHAESDDETRVEGEDVGGGLDLQSLLAMLNGGGGGGADVLSELKQALKAQGLDEDALNAVLEDMISGKQREFDDEDEDEESQDEHEDEHARSGSRPPERQRQGRSHQQTDEEDVPAEPGGRSGRRTAAKKEPEVQPSPSRKRTRASSPLADVKSKRKGRRR